MSRKIRVVYEGEIPEHVADSVGGEVLEKLQASTVSLRAHLDSQRLFSYKLELAPVSVEWAEDGGEE